jgi:uncharacterized caspase-like protein
MKFLATNFTRISILAVLIFLSNTIQAQCVSGDCKNGTGIYLYPSGAKYIGQFKDGEIHGIGTCYYTDGSTYRGEWAHRYPEGNGIKTSADGRTWEGKWKMGLPIGPNGKPIENLFPEEKIVEEIQSGCLQGDCDGGQGIFAYPDGSKYEGQFLAGKPDGWGTFTYTNGDRYVGTYKNGLKNGKGTFFYADNTQATGEWREGEYLGNPQIEYGRVGCVEGDCENGRGTYIYKDGVAKYIGTFSNGQPDGDGVIYYANGERYRGRWALGSFNGKGTLYMPDGTEVTGFWKDGSFMGNEKPQPAAPAAPSLSPEDYIAIRKASDMKVWAVIIGISSYNHMPTLRYTDDDAYRMYAFLKSPEGGALTDDQIRILIDEDATYDKITGAMHEVFAKAGKDDLVLLYFSGHGLRGSFLPIDFNGYNNKLEHEEINKILDASPAKYKLCIADACHSGSLLAMAEKSGEIRNVLEDYYKTLAQADAGTALIMSSKSEETSLESSGLRQGVFSHFLIRGLKGEADKDGNKIVTVQELFDFVDQNVRTYTMNRQSPVIKGVYDGKMTVGVVR